MGEVWVQLRVQARCGRGRECAQEQAAKTSSRDEIDAPCPLPPRGGRLISSNCDLRASAPRKGFWSGAQHSAEQKGP